MRTDRHSLTPGDLAERPRPGEREIFNKPAYTGHLERAEHGDGRTVVGHGREEGARI